MPKVILEITGKSLFSRLSNLYCQPHFYPFHLYSDRGGLSAMSSIFI